MVGSLALLSLALGAAPLEWTFQQPSDVVSTSHFSSSRAGDGLFRGLTEWDPFLYVQMPEGGFDAKVYTRLTVRLYSSSPADQLGIYYGADDGRWGLGHSAHRLQAGWAEYRVDLSKLNYRENSGGDLTERWGGATQRVTRLRLDPGNEGQRWLAMALVRLEPADDRPFEVGVTPLPAGRGALVKVEAPASVQAGQPIDVTVTASLAAAQPARQHAVIWLISAAGEIVDDWVRAVDLAPGTNRWTGRFVTRAYDRQTDYRLRVALMGTDLSGAGQTKDLATVAVRNPKDGHATTPLCEVRRVGGAPTFHVDGRPLAMHSVQIPGVRRPEQRREMAAAGVHVYFDWFGGSMQSDLGHIKPEVYDYSLFDRYFAEALADDPQALFFLHIGITPPSWWQQKYPEELCLYASGRRGPQSFASERWRRETAEDVRRLIAHLQRGPYAERIVGYCPFSGYSAEWQSWGLWNDELADYSAPAQRAWRTWLTQRYGDDARLRAAWANPTVSLAEPPMPTPQQRHRGGLGALRDASKERQVIDYYEFLANLTADAIGYFMKVAKDACGRKSLVGTYYGYLTQHNVRQADSSHCALAKVLDSPDVDFLMSPPLYTGREVTGTSGFMSATESVLLHGKVWLNEADYRTHLSAPTSGFGRASDLAGSQAVLLRDFGQVLCHRTEVSQMDMDGGWLAGPDLPVFLGRLRQLQQAALAGRQPFSGDVAVVVDEGSFAYGTAMHPLNLPLSLLTVAEQPRAGLSWDHYLMSDLARDDLPAHKLYLFCNAFRVTDRQREVIHARLARERATAVWIYAPGYYGDTASGVEPMRRLTGFDFAPLAATQPLKVTSADGRDVLADARAATGTAFAVTGDGERLGLVGGTVQVGLARRQVGAWTSVFSAAPALRPATLRDLARKAGCHVYCETDDALSVDNRYLSLHATTAGAKTIRWPRSVTVRDALTGEMLGKAVSSVTWTARQGETRLLVFE